MGLAVEIKIVAICVLYQTEDNFFPILKDILNQVSFVILVDNGCESIFENKIKKIISNDKKRIFFIQEEKNVGLALAQNHGIEFSKKLGADYIIFFDDDSSPNDKMVTRMVNYAKKNLDVGIVAPDIQHVSGGLQKYWVKDKYFWRRRTFKDDESVLIEVNTVISSGSLIPIKIIQELGGMRADYFIDYIDIEYCLRVRKAGYRISVLRDAGLKHSLGNRSSVKTLGISLYPTHHSPLRKYYMTRNRVFTWKIYANTMKIWFLIDVINFVFDTMRMLLFESDKKEKIISIYNGFREGFRTKK